MTPEQFAYWLQGFAEISQKAPTEKEWQVIKDHLATVFKKVTPDRTITSPEPSVSPGKIWPNDPMKPDPWPTKPIIYPTIPAGPWTMPPNYPKPEIICSVAPGAGTNWNSGAGDYNYNDFTIKNQTDERFRL